MSTPPYATPAGGEGAAPWRFAFFLRATVGKFIFALYRTRVLGRENLPAGGYVLAGNHVSYLDPVLLWCAAPEPTHFIAKQELFDVPLVGWFVAQIWAFPIKRATADRVAIARATALLKHGEPVAIFPEGTRQRPGEAPGDLGEAHEGVAFIAMRAGAPVVPVGIAGTDRALPRGARLPRFPRVTISYGQPVHPEEYAALDRKQRLQAMTAEVMRRIAEQRHLAEEG